MPKPYTNSVNLSVGIFAHADVSYILHGGSPPVLERGSGVPIEPAEYPHIEITSIKVSSLDGKNSVDLLPIFPGEGLEELQQSILEKELSYDQLDS